MRGYGDPASAASRVVFDRRHPCLPALEPARSVVRAVLRTAGPSLMKVAQNARKGFHQCSPIFPPRYALF